MIEKFLKLYSFFFARKLFYFFNKLLFHMGLRGLGILNYYSWSLSGEKRFINEYVSDGSFVLFDVGANIGLYAKKVIRKNPNTKAYLFEPNPKTFEILKKYKTSNVQVFNFGFGENNQTLTLYDVRSSTHGTHASLYREAIPAAKISEIVSYDVEIKTIDDFVEHNEITIIDLLKIDVEGNELSVLKGARKTIEKSMIKMIHIEFNEMNVYSRAFLLDFLRILDGYRPYRMLQDSLLPLNEYKAVYFELFAYQNIVFIKE